MKTLLFFSLLILTGCSHSLVIAYGSGDGVFPATQMFHPQPAVEAVLPTPKAVQNESKLSKENAGLFAPGKQPL